MPSRYLYVVHAGGDEFYISAAYGREGAVEQVFGKNVDIEWREDRKDRSYFRVGNLQGEVYVVQTWKGRKMVRKTEKNFWVMLRDGWAFMNEEELATYRGGVLSYLPELRKYIVKVEKFGRRENVKDFTGVV